MLSSFLVIVPLFAAVNAANDWSVPCITGECSYDLPATNGSTASGTVTIWGSQDAITDITTAANWEILDCDANALNQSIRLVCTSDAADSNCSHLSQNTGAVNKIVRLPENCGSSAFARVAKAWVSEDQSIPSSIAARLVRRDGTQPQVQALALDTDFGSVDYSKTGQVNIAIQGANVPGASGTIQIPPSRRSTRLSQRSLSGFVQSALSDISGNAVNLNQTIDLPPLTLDKSINLFNQSIQCGPVTAEASADLDGNVNAVASVGVVATGTIVPPTLTQLALLATLNGNVTGTLSLTADVAGSVDSGQIELLSLPILGLDIPGILSVGPTFTVNAQATANLDVNLDMQTEINLQINNAQLSFPPGSGSAPNGNAFSIGDTPLSVSASPDVTATGTVAVHLIPALNFGISAFGDVAKAEVDLAFDASLSLQLSLDGSASVQTSIDLNGSGNTNTDSSNAYTTTSTSENSMHTTTDSGKMMHDTTSKKMMHDSTSTKKMMHDNTSTKKMMHDTTSKKMMHDTTSTKAMMHTTSSAAHAMQTKAAMAYGRADVSSSFGGSFEVDAGIAITAGVQGDFFGLFNDNENDTLFSKNFVLFQKSFGDQATRKRSMFSASRVARQSSLKRRAGLSCPAANVGAPASLVDETIKSAAIKVK
ncbi:hypothetical protein B0H12DRAFT_1099380 [Mycena haematopus]|nr:hypothetical protein B0H12DRAFT_1099380 [Mycena haematopus]